MYVRIINTLADTTEFFPYIIQHSWYGFPKNTNDFCIEVITDKGLTPHAKFSS
jgi:hypothetical protein